MRIVNGLLALPGEPEPVPADLLIHDGRIASVTKRAGPRTPVTTTAGSPGDVFDARGMLVLPGAIDPHVHFNDPGYTEREDFLHGTSAAASGGVTTVIDMPCTSVPPVTSLKNLETKLAAIGGQAVVDYGVYGGVRGRPAAAGEASASREASAAGEADIDVAARCVRELAPSVLGFKCYFASGMESFPRVTNYELASLLEVAREANRPVLLHAEDHDYVRGATAAARARGSLPRDYHDSRPQPAETLAVLAACELAAAAGAELHIVHVSTARAARLIAEAPHVTAETAPHYLAFSLSDFEVMGSALKVTPPVKPEPNREHLWRALADGLLDFAGSDHAPAPTAAKQTGSIWSDYAGIPGTGTLLPYLYSEGYARGRLSLERLLAVTSGNAARRFGLHDRKGSIEPGMDGDLVVIDPAADWTVRGESFLSKGRLTPFEGHTFAGRVVATIVRGTVVYESGRGVVAPAGYGRLQRSCL